MSSEKKLDTPHDPVCEDEEGKIESEDEEGKFDREAWLADKEPYLRKRFEELFKQQDSVDKLFEALAQERHQLEDKYIKLCAPYLEKRNSIVRGDLVPEGGEGDVKGIPGFWVKVLGSHDAFAEIISDKDKQVLAHLQDVHVVRETITGLDSKPRWTVKLVFSFSPNEFFEEKELTKTYVYLDQEESIAERATGCDIKWKAGKDVTKKFMKKKDSSGVWKHKTIPGQSVFSFFSPVQIPDGTTAVEHTDELEEAIEMDFALGSAIADDIVPSALKYYTGQAALEDEDDDDEDEEDDDDDGDDDDDDADGPPLPGKGNPECTQQ